MKTIIEEGEPPVKFRARSVSRQSRVSSDRRQSLQIKTILVPLDFSRASMQALKYTISFAQEFGSTIHLVHVQPVDEMTAISRAGHLMLNCADAIALIQDRLAEIQRKRDVRFWPDNCHVVSGRPFEEICKLAREIEADLIVLPTRGHSGLKHVVLGSTAERVFRYAPCPVLVLRGAKDKSITWNGAADTAGLKLRKILVPVDFSKCSLAGAKYAARLAKSTDATLRLLHVVFPYAQVFGMDRVGADLTPLIETAKTTVREELSELMGMSILAGVSCETEIRTGSAIDEICAETGRDDIDLVVTSTHGRTGFKRALIGSVAEHVVRYAECPVIIVPSRGRS
jgi:nucleotide-binding universal stress UspA family protein